MKITRLFKEFIFVLFRPKFWYQSYDTCYIYDKNINLAIEKYGIKQVDRYTVLIGDVEIWIRNYPYAFGNVYSDARGDLRLLPAPTTRKKILGMLKHTSPRVLHDPWNLNLRDSNVILMKKP